MMRIKIEMPLPKYILNVIEKLKTIENAQVYVVGGCIRDFLLNKEPHDYDITTNLLPDQIKSCFTEENIFNNNGLKHGTVSVLQDGETVEITTFRVDQGYEDHRHPNSVVFTPNLIDDLKRRDITINAFAYDGKYLYDYFNGVSDLRNHIVRCVGNAEERFSEDALRILRVIRFSSILNFSIEKETLNAIGKLYQTLSFISTNRITSELNKIVVGDNFINLMSNDIIMNVLCFIIPEFKDCIGFDQHSKYHKHDVFNHTLNVVNYIASKNYDLKLAALFHDIGKPSCHQLDPDNSHYHFKGHAYQSKIITEKILSRLNYSTYDSTLILFLIENHDYEITETKRSIRRFILKIPKTLDKDKTFKMFLELRRADRKDHIYGNAKLVDLDKVNELYKTMKFENEVFSLKNLAINGYDLIELGYKGKQIGYILNLILSKVADEKLKNIKNEIIEYIKTNIVL